MKSLGVDSGKDVAEKCRVNTLACKDAVKCDSVVVT